MRIITLIPAYNEKEHIAEVVEKCLPYSDVVVIDDGSQDNTSVLARNAGAEILKHTLNKGKGAAIKTGLHFACEKEYHAIILIDGDGQHNPHDIPLLLSEINGFDLVIGSRFKKTSPANMPLQRRMSNKLTTFLMSNITGYHLTDSQSGFRALSIRAAKLFLNIEYDDYVYESEMIYQSCKHNLNLKEVPIPSQYGHEKSHITFRHALNYFLFALKRVNNKKRHLYEKVICTIN